MVKNNVKIVTPLAHVMISICKPKQQLQNVNDWTLLVALKQILKPQITLEMRTLLITTLHNDSMCQVSLLSQIEV